MLLLKPYQSAQAASPSYKWQQGKALVSCSKSMNEPEVMLSSRSKSQIQFLSLAITLTISLLVILHILLMFSLISSKMD